MNTHTAQNNHTENNSIIRLRQAGLKATLPRLRILELLQSKSVGVDARDIYLDMLKIDSSTNLSTVYSVLKQLANSGLASMRPGADRRMLFSVEVDANQIIFTCARCGQASTLNSSKIEESIHDMLKDSIGECKMFNLEIFGTCQHGCRTIAS